MSWQDTFNCNIVTQILLKFHRSQNLTIMISSSAFDVLLSFLILGLFLNQLNASRQVTLTCGSDEATQKGSPGSPGKRGPKGSIGAPGRKGIFV